MKGSLAIFHYFVSLIVFAEWSRASSLNDFRGSRETRNMGMMSDEHDDDDHIRMPKSVSGNGAMLGSSLFHPGLEPLITHTGIGLGDHVPAQGQCEPIKISLCMEVGYNQTTMPNLVGHDAQADADALLQTFTPLIQYGCSPHLKLFLCSAHAPMCTDKVPEPIGPCRSLCESVRRKCEPVLTEFGFKWPPPLDCSKFYPMNNHEHMCIPGPMDPNHSMLGLGGDSIPTSSRDHAPSSKGHKDTSSRGQPPTFPQRGLSIEHIKTGHEFQHPDYPKFPVNNPNTGLGIGSRVPQVKENPNSSSSQCVGPRRFWTKNACWIKCSVSGSSSDSESGGVSQLFTESEKTFARNYALPWAILSLSTALIAFLLSLGSPKLNTAERPIIYIALCQIMYSTGVILGTTMSLSCFLDKSTGMELLAGKGTVPSPCAVVFLMTYFFGTASTLWWVVLCLSWMLSLNRKLRQSLEQKEWSLFYLLTWGLASVLTSAALIYKKVDADELTGLCGVGFQDMDALTYYQMVPLNASLSLGLVFLLCGLLYRVFPTWNTFLCNLGQSRVKTNAGSGNIGAGGARHNLAYSPVLVLPPPPTHCPSYDPHSNSSPAFPGTGNNSSSGLQRIRALEISKAVWKRIGIFSLFHIIPLACQVGTMAYELSERENWESGRARPPIQVFLLRINTNLWSGIPAVVWVLSTYSWKTLSALLCPRHLLLGSSKNEADTRAGCGSASTRPPHTTPTSPLLIPVPCNSSATSFITSAHSLARQQQPYNSSMGNNGGRQNFAGILPRCHNHPLPPLPVRNTPEQRTDAWRRGETIV